MQAGIWKRVVVREGTEDEDEGWWMSASWVHKAPNEIRTCSCTETSRRAAQNRHKLNHRSLCLVPSVSFGSSRPWVRTLIQPS